MQRNPSSPTSNFFRQVDENLGSARRSQLCGFVYVKGRQVWPCVHETTNDSNESMGVGAGTEGLLGTDDGDADAIASWLSRGAPACHRSARFCNSAASEDVGGKISKASCPSHVRMTQPSVSGLCVVNSLLTNLTPSC